MTGALHVLYLPLSPPLPSSLVPMKPADPVSHGKIAVKTERITCYLSQSSMLLLPQQQLQLRLLLQLLRLLLLIIASPRGRGEGRQGGRQMWAASFLQLSQHSIPEISVNPMKTGLRMCKRGRADVMQKELNWPRA